MVLAGQFLERPALIDAGDALLEGLFHRGRRRPALLLCPPREGGGMDAPVVAELAWAAARAGHPSLRFQHRGQGASQGRPDPARALDDALAAWRHLEETVGGAVALAGVATGCETALAVARARPTAGLVLVAPPRVLAPAPSTGPALVLLPEHGVMTAEAAGLARGNARVEVIPGADPGFRAGLPHLGRAVAAWLAQVR